MTSSSDKKEGASEKLYPTDALVKDICFTNTEKDFRHEAQFLKYWCMPFCYQLSETKVGWVMTPSVSSRTNYIAKEYISIYDMVSGERSVVTLPHIKMHEISEMMPEIVPENINRPSPVPVRIMRLPNDEFIVVIFNKIQKYKLSDNKNNNVIAALNVGKETKLKKPLSKNDKVNLFCDEKGKEFVIIHGTNQSVKDKKISANVVLVDLATKKQSTVFQLKSCGAAAGIETCMISPSQIMVMQREKEVFSARIYAINFKSKKVTQDVSSLALMCADKKLFDIQVSDDGGRLFYRTEDTEYVNELVRGSANDKISEFKQVSFPLTEIDFRGPRYISPSGDLLLRVGTKSSHNGENILSVLNVPEKIKYQMKISGDRIDNILFPDEDMFIVASKNTLTKHSTHEFRNVEKLLDDVGLIRNVRKIILDYGFFNKLQQSDKIGRKLLGDNAQSDMRDRKENGSSPKNGSN